MTVAEILGWAVCGLTMVAHSLNMRKVWWAPIYGGVVQLVWIAYALSDTATKPLLLLALWYLAWYIGSIRKWKRER